MFNIMSNSIKYRENIYNIQKFEADGFTAGIYQEVIAFIWETFMFENLYLTEIEDFNRASEDLTRQIVNSPWTDLTEEYELPEDFSFHRYAFISGLIDRYTDFFAPNTKMRYFHANYTVFE